MNVECPYCEVLNRVEHTHRRFTCAGCEMSFTNPNRKEENQTRNIIRVIFAIILLTALLIYIIR